MYLMCRHARCSFHHLSIVSSSIWSFLQITLFLARSTLTLFYILTAASPRILCQNLLRTKNRLAYLISIIDAFYMK